ncbi:MAG TPA: peptidoglycan recognition protein [Actinomycetota bacterium]|nr:peptidoglycan recognition protein [Actinomycetota bacterium]
MPVSKPVVRIATRITLVAAVSSALLAGLLPLRGRAAPPIVVRTVPVAIGVLQTESSALRTADGMLRARTTTRTVPTVVCAPMRATGLGVTWHQYAGGDVDTLIRTPTAVGGWSPRVRLESGDEPDPGSPDAATGTRGTSFLWTGGSRCVRLRLELDAGVRLSNLSVVFVDSSGDVPSPAGSLGVASALARAPRIVTRDEWGADPGLMNCTPLVADEVRMGFVHHTAGTNNYTRDEADDVIRGVYAYHTSGRGWCDIGYNFLVDRFGTIYEGRSGGTELPVIGAAQAGFNTGAVSVSVMGNFQTAQVPDAVKRALVRLLAWRLDVAHVNPSSHATMTSAGGSTTRYDAGTVVRLHAISGHRDTGLTECPGANLYPLLPSIRDRVARRGLPKIWNPRLNHEQVTVGEPVNIRILARASAELDWSVTVLDPAGALFADLGGQTADALEVIWPPGGPPAHPTVPGLYTVLLSATDARGRVARPATLSFEVVSALSPSPSPSVSPLPSASPS